LKRIARTGADRTNYRRKLNRAYLVLTLIWIFAGLIYPLYRADELRELQEEQLSACLRATSGNEPAMQNCYDAERTRVLARDPTHAFESTYGDMREWPVSIFLVCILPPLLCYGAIRFLVFAVSATLPRPQPTSKQT
jgi:hypothetical protein